MLCLQQYETRHLVMHRLSMLPPCANSCDCETYYSNKNQEYCAIYADSRHKGSDYRKHGADELKAFPFLASLLNCLHRGMRFHDCFTLRVWQP